VLFLRLKAGCLKCELALAVLQRRVCKRYEFRDGLDLQGRFKLTWNRQSQVAARKSCQFLTLTVTDVPPLARPFVGETPSRTGCEIRRGSKQYIALHPRIGELTTITRTSRTSFPSSRF
jgi:hypothetical protein